MSNIDGVEEVRRYKALNGEEFETYEEAKKCSDRSKLMDRLYNINANLDSYDQGEIADFILENFIPKPGN